LILRGDARPQGKIPTTIEHYVENEAYLAARQRCCTALESRRWRREDRARGRRKRLAADVAL